jgi:regulatory protein
MTDPEEVKRGVDVATGFISYRMRSEFEVRRRLRRAGLSELDVSSVIVRLKEMMLVDDSKFAGAYSRDQLLGMKRGPIRVRNGLSSLGVDKEIAAAAVEAVTAEHDTFELALNLGQRRWDKLGGSRDRSLRRKRVYEFLVRRGYPYDEARRVIDELERAGGES